MWWCNIMCEPLFSRTRRATRQTTDPVPASTSPLDRGLRRPRRSTCLRVSRRWGRRCRRWRAVLSPSGEPSLEVVDSGAGRLRVLRVRVHLVGVDSGRGHLATRRWSADEMCAGERLAYLLHGVTTSGGGGGGRRRRPLPRRGGGRRRRGPLPRRHRAGWCFATPLTARQTAAANTVGVTSSTHHAALITRRCWAALSQFLFIYSSS